MENMDEYYMKIALHQAELARKADEVPIGAIVVNREGEIIAKARNRREKDQNAIAHAEVLAIEKACKKMNSWRLEGCTLYVTLEPCTMCSGATILSRIDRVVFGAYDQKAGAVVSIMNAYDRQGYNHYPKYTSGILEEECSKIIKEYFQAKRKKK